MASRAVDVGGGGCGWAFGKMDNLQSRSPMTSLHPRRITSLVGLRTMTDALLYITEQPLSYRGPMPMSLRLKAAIMFLWRKFNYSTVMVQDDTDLCAYPVAVPTITGGTLGLRSLQGKYVVMYMPLAPASAITVSLGRIIGGGIHLGVAEVSSKLIFLLILSLLTFRQISLL